MASEEHRLCRRAQRGDKGAVSELLKVFYKPIFSYLRRLCGDEQQAEDLTQETFIKAWSSLAGYGGRSRFSTWIHAIAYRVYLDWLRKAGRQERRPNEWWKACVDHNPGPFENAVQRQMAIRLYEAVERLEYGRKQVVHLYYYQGLTLRETAQVLNIATSTVKYRIREIMKTLRSEMDHDGIKQKQKQSI